MPKTTKIIEDQENKILIYNTDDGKTAVSLYAKDGNIWMNQNQLAQLFDTSKQNISLHIQNIIKEWELSQNSVVKNYLTTASDNKEYSVTFYSLDMILAIGFRVKSKRGTQFRQWANQNLKEYMIKGHLIDSERLKNPDGRPDYFDELLEKIRDIRASEKRFYQKVRDLFKLSRDYDADDKKIQIFFAETQNKMLYAITGKTAAEIIIDRADSNQSNMALTSWKWSIVRKQDIYTAKNYLTEDEINTLNRFVVVFLETAELRAKGRQDITIDFWKENVDRIIHMNDKKVLDHKGSISRKKMEEQVEKIYEEFNKRRKLEEAKNADLEDLEEIEKITKRLKK